ncbi:hypothetical protein RF11_11214 [Thelohanellus kitauei]|uniref:Uncharacterized protein n=1 Tax=Thelohanellus kitauei TaxID=669202 RepID=A0A0C2MSG7_THEKT|nr:hypothetical protein RF11_11214 [Thelohanellus kitauei]
MKFVWLNSRSQQPLPTNIIIDKVDQMLETDQTEISTDNRFIYPENTLNLKIPNIDDSTESLNDNGQKSDLSGSSLGNQDNETIDNNYGVAENLVVPSTKTDEPICSCSEDDYKIVGEKTLPCELSELLFLLFDEASPTLLQLASALELTGFP